MRQVTLESHYAVCKSWILSAFSGNVTVTWMMVSGKARRNIIMLNGCQAENYKLYIVKMGNTFLACLKRPSQS